MDKNTIKGQLVGGFEPNVRLFREAVDQTNLANWPHLHVLHARIISVVFINFARQLFLSATAFNVLSFDFELIADSECSFSKRF